MTGKSPKREKSTSASGTPAAAPEPPKASVVREWIKSGAYAMALFLVLRTFVLQTFVITSGSMEGTLLVGDYLIVNRAAIGSRLPLTGEPGIRIPGYSSARRGDVIVFDPPHEQNMKLVKRLIGMPGDTIEMRDKALFVNGVEQEEPYVRHGESVQNDSHPWMRWQGDYLASGVDRASYHPTVDTWGPLVVPEDRYFMLGDNRDASFDSRYWGLLEGWRLEGRASRIYYSFDTQSVKPFRFLRDVRAGRIGAQVR